MTNDYMFRAINQKNPNVTKGIICAVLHLNVVDLTQIELSTDADKESQLDLWARFFKTETWEEIIMIAEKNPYIAEAAQSLYESHADEVTEMQCRARRDYYKQKNTTEKIMRELTTENLALNKENAVLNEKNSALNKEVTQLHARI